MMTTAERNHAIAYEYLFQKRSVKEISESWHLSVGTIRNILKDDQQRQLFEVIPVQYLSSFKERMKRLFGYMLIDEDDRHRHVSLGSILRNTSMHIRLKKLENGHIRSYANTVVTPEEWVKWIKNATYEEILKVRCIGPKKAGILMDIQHKIISEPEIEKMLLDNVQSLF